MRTRRQRMWVWAAAALVAAGLPLCGCGGGGDEGVPGGGPGTGIVVVRVTDVAGALLAGATVTVRQQSAVTGSDGIAVLTGVPAGATTVSAALAGYVTGVEPIVVVGGSSFTLSFPLERAGATVTIPTTATTPQPVTDQRADGLNATVFLQPSNFVTTAGQPVQGPVQVSVTTFPITDAGADAIPGLNLGIAPGATAPEPLTTYGAVSISATDAAGNPVDLDLAQTVMIVVPMAANVDPGLPTLGVWLLDPNTGFNTEVGTATRDASVTPVVYRAQLTGLRSRGRPPLPFQYSWVTFRLAKRTRPTAHWQ
ncbi:MAG: carboxypeptidase regulatory-like domain-containing protein [Armatimonadetes bacterium]|nr:carboxypeptidase regulatory-like domain-containing protein [Armatimonadota bacterium]